MDKFSELKAAAEKYSVALNAHRENPKDADAVVAWDEATWEMSRLINNDEVNIIVAMLAELEQKGAKVDELSRLLAHNIERAESAEKLLEDRLEKWQELASNQVIKINELQAKLATPVINSADSDPQRKHFGCSVRTTDSGTFYITKLGSVPGRDMALYRNEAEALFIGLRDALSAGFTVEGDE
ncbi:hypothetical protein [Serratia plymuthica]|uniref:hypothetical protein n=1 Tax=Serratia plymuthica TaxID=82996 RepID=UPI00141963BB|nr:hypothetical protein [Serratia plymuthica]NIC28256.1 hypothetical protein [Serratia plymuthica]